LRKDHRPYAAKRLHRVIERSFVTHFVAPQLDSLGPDFKMMKPWNLKLHGPNISFGKCVHVITDRHRKVQLTVWEHEHGEGHIDISDYCLLCPGVRLDSASGIEVGPSSMIASTAYLTDSDWHDIYDRSRPIGNSARIVLEENVWVGDSAIVCKGVSIGRNSVIGAGAVVTNDIPANSIAVGNPARVVKTLDPTKALRRREDLLHDPQALDVAMDGIDRYLLGDNSWFGWLRALMAPRRGD
jgi:acetyltransferase-like isoleucine patch superfamily enzyme